MSNVDHLVARQQSRNRVRLTERLVKQRREAARTCACGGHKGPPQIVCLACFKAAPAEARNGIYAADITVRREAVRVLRVTAEMRVRGPASSSPASNPPTGASACVSHRAEPSGFNLPPSGPTQPAEALFLP